MGHWDRGVSAVGDILNVSACRVIEGNLITSPQPPLAPAPVRNRTEAGEQDHINHKRILPGARSLSQLCQNNIQTTIVTLLYFKMDTSQATNIQHVLLLSCLCFFFFANLSLLVFQDESNSHIALPFIPQFLSHLAFLHIFPSLLPAFPLLPFFLASSFAPCTPSVYDW